MNISTRELAQQIAALSRRIDALSAPQLSRSSIEDGAIHEYDVDGNLVTIIGRQGDGSHGVVVIDGPEPLRTSTPIAEAGALTIAAQWDGNFIDPDTGTVDASLPAYDDFKHIEVHVGDETGFNPDKNTLAGFIPNRDGGEVSVPAEAGTRYVRFVTRAISSKTSVPSVATEVEVDTLVDVGQFDRLRDLLDQAAAWIAETGAELDQRLADAESDLADAQAGLDEAAERLNTLRDVTLPALYLRLDEAEGRLADIPDLMEDLQGAIDDANAAIDALDIDALRGRLEGVEGDLSDLQGVTLPALRDDVDGAQGRLDEAFGEGASWNLSDAFDDVQDAIDLTPRPHMSTDAPGNTIMPLGTRWEQIDSAGRVIGIWEQTTAPEGASWATRALDLSVLRASSAVIDDLLVERMAVAIATVIELNADRITSGQIDAEFIDVSDLSAALATVLELDAGVITTGELGAERINVEDLTAAVATIIELNADRITSGQITSARIDTSELAATLATIIELDAGTITSGTIDTARLDAVELAAEMAEFIQARIENLVVTQGATIDEAVINKLWTDVVRSRKITTDMLLVGSGDNLVPNGNLVGDVSEYFTDMTGVSVLEADGGQVLRIIGTHTKETDAFEIAPGEYRFSVEARADVANTRFYVRAMHNGPGTTPYMIANQVIDGRIGFGSSGMQWKTYTGTLTVPVTGFGNTMYLSLLANHVNGVTGAGQEFRGFRLTSMSDASLIVDGAIAARHIDAESIAAEVAEFISVKAENIEAGNIQVALTLSAAGRIIAGQADGAAAELSSRGLEVWTTDASGDRHDIPLTRLGVPGATDVLSISDGTDVVASITPDGAISGSSLDVGEDAHIGGQLLMGAFAYRDAGGSGDRDSAFWQLPWGVQGPVTDMARVAGHLSAANNTTQLLLYDTFRLFAGRAYRFVADMTIDTTNIQNTALAHAIFRMQKTEVDGFNSVPAVPSLSSSQNILFRRVYTPGSGVNAPMTMTIIPGRDETARVAIAISGIQATQAIEAPSKFYLEDMGATEGYGGGVPYGQSTPPVQKYTYYFYPTAVVSKQGTYSSTITWNGVSQVNKMVQGWIPGVQYGPWHTFGRFYNASSVAGSSQTGVSLSSAISGATRVEARVRLTSAFSARNTVQARLSARTNETTVPAPQVTTSAVAPGGTITTALNSTMLNTLRNSPGSLRIAVGPGSGTSNVDMGGFYGSDGNTNQRMRLQVDVWK